MFVRQEDVLQLMTIWSLSFVFVQMVDLHNHA